MRGPSHFLDWDNLVPYRKYTTVSWLPTPSWPDLQMGGRFLSQILTGVLDHDAQPPHSDLISKNVCT